MNRTRFCMVFVTAPDMKTSRKLASAVLGSRLGACVNLIPKIESHYWWEGKLEKGAEVLMIIKTTRAHLSGLEKIVMANHPYNTPEFVVVPICSGNRRYLNWLSRETT